MAWIPAIIVSCTCGFGLLNASLSPTSSRLLTLANVFPFDTVVVYFVATMIKLKVSIDNLSKSGLSKLTLLTDLNYLSPILAVFIRDGAFFFFM